VEVASVPFVTFIANKNQNGETANYSFVQRGYVRHWLGQVWEAYDRIKLKDIVANGETNTSRPRPQVVKVADSRKSE
jgi:hypothetical protein